MAERLRYVFKRRDNGEVLERRARSLNQAVHDAGLKRSDVEALECWVNQTRLWHIENGEVVDG